MSSERLREAARLMRERAEAATSGPWISRQEHWRDYTDEGQSYVAVTSISAISTPDVAATAYPGDSESDLAIEDAEHIASWHPAVALAVAEWLDDIATRHAPSTDTLDLYLHYNSDEECEECELGGHECVVCEGCYPSYEGMDGHVVYPCRETTAALAVADAYLGAAP